MRVSIDEQVATTEVVQVFYNPNPIQMEGTYVYPIPPGAAFDQFKKALKQADRQLVSEEHREMSKESQELEDSREGLLEERGGIETNINRLGSEEESSALRARRNVLAALQGQRRNGGSGYPALTFPNHLRRKPWSSSGGRSKRP